VSRKVQVEWPDFPVAIKFDLLDEENPKLCQRFWESLPFETVFAASMSAGEMFKVPIPFKLPDAPSDKLVFFPEQADGTILALGRNGLLVKYGRVAEPFRLPRIGNIPESGLGRLREVAIKLRDAYFFTKVVNKAIFSRTD
jgi:hypothetical protein